MLHRTTFVLLLIFLCTPTAHSADWSVPTAGNAFRTAPAPDGGGRSARRGAIAWEDAEGEYSIYFHVDRPAKLTLAIDARAADETPAVLQVDVGEQAWSCQVVGTAWSRHAIGEMEVPEAGYVRVRLRGTQRSGATFAEIRNLVVSSETNSLAVDYVRTNDGNMFYWGRRGPSVHLRYQVPRDRDLQYAYSEVNVPVGEDPIGSFYMANGFGEGYFGMQVNGPDERRVLFSVWSPFATDNPRDIPEDQRIVLLGRGPDVRVGEFGNEGSGGQSFLVYPWQAGVTYRFLTEVRPDGEGNTVYTAWFGDKAADEWRLIASFRRPKTDTHLRGFHSFLESFSPTHGYIGRRASYGNVWVVDVDGTWHECTSARFSVDATGGGRHRLDFAGGSDGTDFFLRNCGFFDETGNPGSVFTRQSTAAQRPHVQFDQLPRE